MKNKIILTIVLSLLFINVKAQLYNFTQNTNSLTLSPAFAGIDNISKISLDVKDWNPSISGTFVTQTISGEKFFKKINSGIGFYFLRDANSYIGTNKTVLNYNYQFNLTQRLKLSTGLSTALITDFVDFQKLIFSDMIGSDGYVSNITISQPPLPRLRKIDFSASSIIYSKKFWAGITFDNLMRNSNSLNLFEQIKMPIKISVFGGYKYIIAKGLEGQQKEKSLIFTSFYTNNSINDIFDIRAYVNYNILTFAMGMKRSIFENLKFGFGSSPTIITIIGLNLKTIKIGYSYDYGNSYLQSSHEISINYVFKKKNE